MEYRSLGRTGVQVSPLCLGAMMFGPWGSDDRPEAIRIIHAALDAGINFVDTADAYSRGVSEEIVGEALEGRRDEVVLATKFFFPMAEQANHGGGARRWIMRAVEDSLRRLRTDHIDLYQLHRPDPEADIEETLGALSDLVHQGKVRYLGSSCFTGSQIVDAQWAARARGSERFVTEQPPYSMLVRGIERDVLPAVRRHGMGAMVWSPLAGGWLSGRWRKGQTAEPTSFARPATNFDLRTPANQRRLDIVEELARLAEEAGIPLPQLAVAFAIHHPAVTAAIVGPRTMPQLVSYLPAAELTIPVEILDRIDAIVAPGTDVNPGDNDTGAHDLTPLARRR